MKYIKNYADQAAYDADLSRPANANVVSHIKSIAANVYQQHNIILEADFAGIGDTVVFDTVDLRPKVVKLGSLKLPISGRYIIVGTVYGVDEEWVRVAANVNASSSTQWGAPKKMKLSGFNLSASGSFTFTINSSVTPAIEYTSADTLTTLAVKMQDAIRAVMTIATWTATAYQDYIVIAQNSYTPNVTNFTCSNPLISISFLTGNYQTASSGLITANTSIFRKDGSVTSFAGCVYEKLVSYYSVNGEDVVNKRPGDVNIIRESRFNATDNPELVNYYGTYRNYMADKMARIPYGKGIMSGVSGKINTKALAATQYIDHDGSTQQGYPAASIANAYGLAGSSGFEPGDWWLPSVPEGMLLVGPRTYGLAGQPLDPVNVGIYAAGGAYINPGAHHWMSSEYGANNAWYYYGTAGYMRAYNKGNALTVRPVTAFRKKNI